MLKEAETFTGYVELHNAMTGRTEDSNNIYESLAAGASGTVIVDMNALIGCTLRRKAGRLLLDLRHHAVVKVALPLEFRNLSQRSAHSNHAAASDAEMSSKEQKTEQTPLLNAARLDSTRCPYKKQQLLLLLLLLLKPNAAAAEAE